MAERITETDELIALKMDDAKELRDALAEDDAIEFIEEHMEDLAEGKTLTVVYETNKTQQLEFDDLLPYWDRALELYDLFAAAYTDECITNDDGIPVELAVQIKDNSFDYAFCGMLADYEDGTKWAIQHSLDSVSNSDHSWYNKTNKELEGILREIGVLTLQREQLLRQQKSLAKPAHMKAGLWIFGAITLLDILLPLVFMRLIPANPCIEEWAETISVIFMASGLIATFIYLFYLLGWKHKGVEAQNMDKA